MRAAPVVDFVTTEIVWRTAGSLAIALVFIGSFLPSAVIERVGLMPKAERTPVSRATKGPPPRWRIGPLLFVDTGQDYVSFSGLPILEEQCAMHETPVRFRDEYETRRLSFDDWVGGQKENVWCEVKGHFLDFGDMEYTRLKNLIARAETVIVAERRKR